LASFFNRQTRQFVEQQRHFQELMMAPSNQRLILSSLKVVHALCPQATLSESVIKVYL